MKPAVPALIAATATFLASLVLFPGFRILPQLVRIEPGTSVGWDPISLFHQMGWELVLAAVVISIVTFALVYRHLSPDNK